MKDYEQTLDALMSMAFEVNHPAMLDYVKLKFELKELRRDKARLDWIESAAKKSYTGISFDWTRAMEGDPSGFRFMRRHFIGEIKKTIRAAIDAAMKGEG